MKLFSLVLAGFINLSLARRDMKLITQFTEVTWLENLVVRSDGRLLITTLSSPNIFQVDPLTGHSHTVAEFPYATGTCGIVELEPEVFAVTIGNFSTVTAIPIAHSWSLWIYDAARNTTKKIVDIPQAGMLNGLVAINRRVLFSADSTNGVIYRIEMDARTYRTAIAGTDLSPSASFPFGINGLRFSAPWLYFSNTGRALFGRIGVDKAGALSTHIEIIAKDFHGVLPDDFALMPSGDAYATTNPFNQVMFISHNGSVSAFAGALDSLEVAGCTSAQLSRNHRTLYVITNGDSVRPINGTVSEGGKLVSISLR